MGTTADATVTSKGQVTIPKEIRETLRIEAGTELEFVVEQDGELTVRPKTPPMDRLRAIQDKLSEHDVDLDTMRAESKQAWSSHREETDAA